MLPELRREHDTLSEKNLTCFCLYVAVFNIHLLYNTPLTSPAGTTATMINTSARDGFPKIK